MNSPTGLKLLKPPYPLRKLRPLHPLSFTWRQKKLLVGLSKSDWQFSQNLSNPEGRLQDCLINSPVKLVLVDTNIGEPRINHLADMCLLAEKPLFLRLSSIAELPQKRNPTDWLIKRGLDLIAASLLLVIFSPLMLMLALMIKNESSGPIFFYQWRVGQRGKLFRIIKFRSMVVGAEKRHQIVMFGQQGLHKCENDPRVTRLGGWMRKYSLDELPQLFNVLRGEMSLVGPRPWALYDALRISKTGDRRLNSLPGITGAWQVKSRSTMLDMDVVNECDLDYLRKWSLWTDLKILCMTLPKVLSGFGAF
ncbi:heterocyst development glycosyltransferase HepC [Tumidithrix helvetica]|uniref:heterocyst development glycosyltransferase HepC n=1 Tax=Tumidithrix helvetica TaxID=3457545 RepID=UPI003CC672B1